MDVKPANILLSCEPRYTGPLRIHSDGSIVKALPPGTSSSVSNSDSTSGSAPPPRPGTKLRLRQSQRSNLKQQDQPVPGSQNDGRHHHQRIRVTFKLGDLGLASAATNACPDEGDGRYISKYVRPVLVIGVQLHPLRRPTHSPPTVDGCFFLTDSSWRSSFLAVACRLLLLLGDCLAAACCCLLSPLCVPTVTSESCC